MHISRSGEKRVIITAGDPRGIGPEVILKSLKEPAIKKSKITIVGNFRVFKNAAKTLHINIPPLREGFEFIDIDNLPPGLIVSSDADLICGKASIDYLMYAAAYAESLKMSRASLVTAPINKESVNKAGFAFDGHTELLAFLTKSPRVTMLLVGGNLRVALVTRHASIKDVPGRLRKEKIIETAENTYFALRKFFNIKHPRIGVAALNPHAGEGGMLGKEEKNIIAPAVKHLRRKIKGVFGPEPADTLFYKAYHGKCDAVVCMYHDQGLIPLKMTAFEKGVNLTIGLPFIRTSPDHGTAFDIAGKGCADPSSMIEAIKLAIRLC